MSVSSTNHGSEVLNIDSDFRGKELDQSGVITELTGVSISQRHATPSS